MKEVRYRGAERRLWESVGVTPTEQRLYLGRTGVTVRIQERSVCGGRGVLTSLPEP
jgi:hypothetical protein